MRDNANCTCGHDKKEHMMAEGRQCTRAGCLCPSYHYDISSGLAALGITAGLSSMLLGGMSKMFGLGGTGGDVEIKAKDVMYVMIDGFMGYYNEKLEEINQLKEKLSHMEEELEQKKEHYEEMKCAADKNRELAEAWKKKYEDDKDRELETKLLMLNEELTKALKELDLWKKRYSGLASTHMKMVGKNKGKNVQKKK